ncbi:hypothetical protein FDP41_001540 [Naegleria fowleri]|uniref:Uncharacterized protein n=1 Tax=Naegleria fowleri TaxID=5763 RepID=A0A6A5BQ09_NAEFO|nr:uncharacterized protein FDP41_001540 [Naegleria fowleri]KAF0979197.1 hypothetical protein FDP41_001540 [Naegleria fowleri]CAG4709640.1 unnamed protein product [Naegleria fowleri]
MGKKDSEASSSILQSLESSKPKDCEVLCAHIDDLLFQESRKSKEHNLREEILSFPKSSSLKPSLTSTSTTTRDTTTGNVDRGNYQPSPPSDFHQQCLQYCVAPNSVLNLVSSECILNASNEKKANECLSPQSKPYKKTLKKLFKKSSKEK